MPVIVVGADTPIGAAIVDSLVERGGEVRAFVSNPAVGATLKTKGVKVALGDLSDHSHIGPAAYNAFTAVLIEPAASDGRTLSFAEDASGVLSGWTAALREAGVRRAIWVGGPPDAVSRGGAREVAVVTTADRTIEEITREVADLNDRRTLP